MPYEFHEWEDELEPQTSSARGGGPPRKATTTGVLDPPVPPKRPLGPLPALTPGLWMRVFAIIVLGGLGLAIVLALLGLL